LQLEVLYPEQLETECFVPAAPAVTLASASNPKAYTTCATKTEPYNTLWHDGAPRSIYADLDMSSCNFDGIPLYFTALYGNSVWQHVSGNQIYSPSRDSVRVVLDDAFSIATDANNWDFYWHIGGLGIQMPSTGTLATNGGLCAGQTVPGSTEWVVHAKKGTGIYVDVDTSHCAFVGAPVLVVSIGGVYGHSSSHGSSSLQTISAAGFRLHMFGLSDPLQANTQRWYVSWVGKVFVEPESPDDLPTVGSDGICVGQTTTDMWQVYVPQPTYDFGIHTSTIDTSHCGFTDTPVYVTTIGGTQHTADTTGGSAVYSSTKSGFRVFLHDARQNKSATLERAQEEGWYVMWMAKEIGSASAADCGYQTTNACPPGMKLDTNCCTECPQCSRDNSPFEKGGGNICMMPLNCPCSCGKCDSPPSLAACECAVGDASSGAGCECDCQACSGGYTSDGGAGQCYDTGLGPWVKLPTPPATTATLITTATATAAVTALLTTTSATLSTHTPDTRPPKESVGALTTTPLVLDGDVGEQSAVGTRDEEQGEQEKSSSAAGPVVGIVFSLLLLSAGIAYAAVRWRNGSKETDQVRAEFVRRETDRNTMVMEDNPLALARMASRVSKATYANRTDIPAVYSNEAFEPGKGTEDRGEVDVGAGAADSTEIISVAVANVPGGGGGGGLLAGDSKLYAPPAWIPPPQQFPAYYSSVTGAPGAAAEYAEVKDHQGDGACISVDCGDGASASGYAAPNEAAPQYNSISIPQIPATYAVGSEQPSNHQYVPISLLFRA
jgi:hypothetical protein